MAAMLGLKYVMAKSKELTSKLELGSVVGGARSGHADASSSASSIAGSDAVGAHSTVDGDALSGLPGQAFLVAQSHDWDVLLAQHQKLLDSGEELGEELVRARKRLQEQVESEAYVTQHFHEIARVRESIGAIRGIVEKIALDVEDVEQLLVQQTEEFMAAQNASFVAQQEHELERFEAHILEEKEDRKRQLLEARRHVLAAAFQNDLKTYQTLVSYQGAALTQSAVAATTEESLESVDLVVTADAAQLEAFYDLEDDESSEDERSKIPGFEEEEEKAGDEEEEQEETTPLETETEVEADPSDAAASTEAADPAEQEQEQETQEPVTA